MSSTFETLVSKGLEKGHGDAKGEDELPKDAFADDSGVCPDIENNNMAIQNDNHFNRTLLDQGLDNMSNILTTTTPQSKSSHIKREVQSGFAEGSTFVQNFEQIRAVSGSPSSHVRGIRPDPANGLPNALSYGYQHFKNPSHLRYQFNPNSFDPLSTSFLSNNSSVPNNIPLNQDWNFFNSYGGLGNMYNSVPQPFDESNLRAPVNQYGTSQANPSSPQLHSSYSHQQTCSPIAQFRSPLSNVKTQYGQPRTPPRMVNLGEFQHHPDNHGSGSNITRRVTTPVSAKPHVKQEHSSRRRRRRASPSIASEDENEIQLPSSVPKADAPLVRRLIIAMIDPSAAEDNEGMKRTWEKIRTTKTERLQEKAVQMLRLCRDAQRGPVSEKKAVNSYESFKHRFDELCIAVRTQKTICKHLLEEEYSRSVANDPTFAAQRVKNNRRVNDQKKIAIEVGRRQIGQQGHGKGRKVEQITFLEEEDNSADDPFSDEDEIIPPADNKLDPPRRKRTKKNNDSDDDFEIVTRSSRKTRSENRSAQKLALKSAEKSSHKSRRSKSIISGSPVATRVTRAQRTDQNQTHNMQSSPTPAQRTEQNQMQNVQSSPSSHESPHLHRNDQYHAYNLDNAAYHPMMQSSPPQMVEEQHYGHLPAYQSGPYQIGPYQHHGSYSSGGDQLYSDDMQGNDETDNGGFGGTYDLFGSGH